MASARAELHPISYADIAAWSRLTCQEPSPWEVSVLRRMDAAALNAIHAKVKRDSNRKPGEIMIDDWEGILAMMDRIS